MPDWQRFIREKLADAAISGIERENLSRNWQITSKTCMPNCLPPASRSRKPQHNAASN